MGDGPQVGDRWQDSRGRVYRVIARHQHWVWIQRGLAQPCTVQLHALRKANEWKCYRDARSHSDG